MKFAVRLENLQKNYELGAEANTSYRSIGNGPLALVANIVNRPTILKVSSTLCPGRPISRTPRASTIGHNPSIITGAQC